MPNLQLTLTASREKAECYSEALSNAGALAVTLLDAKVGANEEPIFEPTPGTSPLWGHTQIVGLFDLDSNIHLITTILENQLGKSAIHSLSIDLLGDKQWESVCMDQFHSMQFGQHLWICPSWETPPVPQAANILLDPGIAFGTGTHPTTRLCLEWLDAHPPIGQTVLDYGCGSGILGIAALKLGATQVYAVDYDSQALQSTKDNAQRNGYHSECITPQLPETFNPNIQMDLIVANILANPLMALASQFEKWLKPDAPIILSGLLENQVEKLLEAYDPWFHKTHITSLQEWYRIELIRRQKTP